MSTIMLRLTENWKMFSKKKLKKEKAAFKALATLVAKATVETCLFYNV